MAVVGGVGMGDCLTAERLAELAEKLAAAAGSVPCWGWRPHPCLPAICVACGEVQCIDQGFCQCDNDD